MVERRPLPLFVWQAQQARARERHRRVMRVCLVAAGATIALSATLALQPRPHFVWNGSPSAATGLYRVYPGTPPARGDMVIAWVPSEARGLAARRHYLPANIPLVKRVAAVAGDTVCAVGPVLSVNGNRVAERRRFDTAHRRLPWWEGCATLGKGELFLLMTDAPDSFDGRYFGPTRAADVVGRARLIVASRSEQTSHKRPPRD